MINLFRKLRKKMLTESRLRNYFIYSFGEIVLIVAGILIALQINNWNTERLDRMSEKTYLAQIQANLLKDADRINQVLQFNEAKLEIVNQMLRIFDNRLSNKERADIFQKYSMDFTLYEVFVPVMTSYESLLNSQSIDIISNHELQEKLAEYYGVKYDKGVQERLISMNRKVVDLMFPVFLTRESSEAMFGFPTAIPSINDLDVHKDQQHMSNLRGMIAILGFHDAFLHNMLKQNKALRKLIEKYPG